MSDAHPKRWTVHAYGNASLPAFTLEHAQNLANSVYSRMSTFVTVEHLDSDEQWVRRLGVWKQTRGTPREPVLALGKEQAG